MYALSGASHHADVFKFHTQCDAALVDNHKVVVVGYAIGSKRTVSGAVERVGRKDMNKGVVIKTHAGQKYTSDGMSVAAARELAARAGVPLQYFANRSDKVGGSTLGNLAMAQVSMNCVDIGLPQLAMHSCYETAGAEDTLSLIKLMQELYSSHFEETAFGTLSISK